MNSPQRDEEVRLVGYDPAWPGLFAVEAQLLIGVIGPWITGGVHHVGSTAVPGLAAKPVVDILVGVDNLEGSAACIDVLASLDYEYFPYRANEMHWFCKPGPMLRTHHLHLVPAGSRRFVDELAFRDFLRAHPDRARDYAELKRGLAVAFRFDREAYTRGKSDFVSETLELARAANPA